MTEAKAIELLLTKLDRPLVMIDVGARWGPPGEWVVLKNRATMIGFDADPDECKRLNESGHTGMHFVPAMLGDREGEIDFHIGRNPATSSVFKPVTALYKHYPILAEIETDRTVRLPVSTLDRQLAKLACSRVDVVKLDTQGSELKIMRAGTHALSTAWLVDVEVEFNPIYEGQSLFCDVDRFLRDQGFVLWRLENLVHYAPSIVTAGFRAIQIHADPAPTHRVEAPNGQLFWSQAQYVRASLPATAEASLAASDSARAALSVGLYGHWDLALEIARKGADPTLLGLLTTALEPSISSVIGFDDPRIALHSGARRSSTGIVVPVEASGLITSGPYTTLPAGTYRLMLSFEPGAGAIEGMETEVVSDVGLRVYPSPRDPGAAPDTLAYLFSLKQTTLNIEFRCFAKGPVERELRAITVNRLPNS